jgi:hypothetical protein
MRSLERPWIVSESASLLAQYGLLPRLRAACLMLASTDDAVVRSTTLSLPVPGGATPLLVGAAKRLAEEHCVEAEVELKNERLIVRLRRIVPEDSDA